MLNSCTRPFRALSECILPAATFGGFIGMGLVTWVYIILLIDVHAPWTATTCEFTGPMTLKYVAAEATGGASSDGYRVHAPVNVFEPGPKISGQTWAGDAHRWPSKSMTDHSRAALYNWWLGIGGTGTVLEEPTEGWLGFLMPTEGKFEFTTPIGKRVQCWYLPGKDGVTPTSVKLSNEAVPTAGYNWGMFFFGLMGLIFLAGTIFFFAASFDKWTNKWERLEDADVAAEEAAKQREQMHIDDAKRRMLKRVGSRAGQLVGARAIHRSNSHLFTDPSKYYQGTHAAAIRNGFLRKVYGIILFQVLLTAAVAVLFMYYEPLASHSGSPSSNRWFVYGLDLLMILTLLGCHIFKSEYPLNYLFLCAFTLCMAVIIGIICSVYRSAGYEDLLLQALLYTGFIFSCLTVWTMQSRIRFDFSIVPLSIALLLVIFAGIIARAFRSPILYTVYAYCGSLVFMGYIVFDTYMITQRLGYDDYIVAAIELYLDVINLFLYILQFLSAMSRH